MVSGAASSGAVPSSLSRSCCVTDTETFEEALPVVFLVRVGRLGLKKSAAAGG